MATPTPGTFPSFPPYQPGALQYTGSEIFLLVTSATATAAANSGIMLGRGVLSPSIAHDGTFSIQFDQTDAFTRG